MPEFGLGFCDILIFLSPFLFLYILKRFKKIRFSVGASGAVSVGVLCFFAQRVNLRYGLYYEGRDAVMIGLVYIVSGIFYLIMERQINHHLKGTKLDKDE